MDISIDQYLEDLKKHKVELETVKPVFKPQYHNKHKTKTLREISEHSMVYQIEIHPNIVDELILRERLDRANAFVKSKLAKLTAPELAELQLEIQGVMVDQEIEAVMLKKKESEAPTLQEKVDAINVIEASNPEILTNDDAKKILGLKKGKKK